MNIRSSELLPVRRANQRDMIARARRRWNGDVAGIQTFAAACWVLAG
jgi:hypothetical protein